MPRSLKRRTDEGQGRQPLDVALYLGVEVSDVIASAVEILLRPIRLVHCAGIIDLNPGRDPSLSFHSAAVHLWWVKRAPS